MTAVQRYQSLDDVSLQKSWLTIGVFDGVHRGHQEIMRELTAGAHANAAPAVVLTFYPHPAIVLGRQAGFKYLTLPEEKAALFGALGVDVVINEPFNLELAGQSAEDFMALLKSHLDLRRLLVGHDFALGHDRLGNLARLQQIGQSQGYQVQDILPVTNEAEVISSSRIRARIAQGQVGEAAASLGRYYTLSGTVIHGDGRGRRIHMPTANLDVHPEKLIPANGIYATWAWIGKDKYTAVTNIGLRPTFTPEEQQIHIEAHLLDFDRDLYGREIRLDFVTRLREEIKFPSADALIEQIHADITQARDILK